MFFSAKEIIYIMFGSQWLNSVLSFKILSISIIFQMILSSSGTIFQETNETKKLFYAGLLGAISNISIIIIGVSSRKIEYVAIGVVIAYAINFVTGYYLLINRVFNKNLFDFFKEFKSILFIALICIISLKLFNVNFNNILMSAIYKFIITGLSYILGLYVTKEIKIILSTIRIKK